MIVRNNLLTGQLYLLGKHHFLQYLSRKEGSTVDNVGMGTAAAIKATRPS
jgi:hypothetical protein